MSRLDVVDVKSAFLRDFDGDDCNTKIQSGYLALSHEDVREIVKILTSRGNTVHTVILSGNSLDAMGAEILAGALKHENNRVDTLDLSANEIRDQGAKALGVALQSPVCKLRELDLRRNTISAIGVEELCKGLKHPSCRLERLNLSTNLFGPQGTHHLSEAFWNSSNTALEEIDLRVNRLCDSGIERLAKAFMDPRNKHRIHSLNVGYNDIGPAGAHFLRDLIRHPGNDLHELSVHCNQIGDIGVIALCSGLTDPNNQLCALSVSSNLVRETGARALARAVQHPNCRLETLKFSGNEEVPASALIELLGRIRVSTIREFSVPIPEVDSLDEFALALGSEWVQVVRVLLSLKTVPRITDDILHKDLLRMLPMADLIVLIAEILDWPLYRLSLRRIEEELLARQLGQGPLDELDD